MGQLTRTQIVTQGMLKVGRDDLNDVMVVQLNAWLRSQYKAHPWPFLQRRKTGVSLATGATSLSFGAGSSGVTVEVAEVKDPIWIYNSAYTTKSKARVRQLQGGSLFEDETINDPSTFKGLPTQFKVRADETLWGKWTLVPTPFPDKDYLLAIDYWAIPADINTGTAGDSTMPIYPNDRTLIQAIATETLLYANGADDPGYQDALEVLGAMVIDDRVKYGQVPGTNDMLTLDPNIFR